MGIEELQIQILSEHIHVHELEISMILLTYKYVSMGSTVLLLHQLYFIFGLSKIPLNAEGLP